MNRNEVYQGLNQQGSIMFYPMSNERLLTIGKQDIVLFKQEKANLCFCDQSSFDYKKKNGVFVGKEGKRSTFVLKKFVVYQMI